MPLFLTESERALIRAEQGRAPLNRYFWALHNRASKRAEQPGLRDVDATPEWWHYLAEYLTDAAMACALKPTEQLGAWVRDVTLSVARRPVDDWVGPWFRNHAEPKTGHLETAHVAWSIAVALDLCADVFTATEQDELRASLAERAIPMCRRWLQRNTHLANWRCVLSAGLTVAAAVLDDGAALDEARDEFLLNVETFQPDGSNAESLQYGNYAAYTCMLSCEALLRRGRQVSPARYAGYARWAAHSLLFCKPLSGWGAGPRPRSANFNDCGALTAPSPDLLLHLAARAQDSHPTEAALARWLVDTVYEPTVGQGPQDRATFGFVNRFGFLTLPLLPQACEGQSPAALHEPTVAGFSCGDVLARDGWRGRTVLAVHGGGEPLYGPGHLHGDLNSFILVHNRERLLVDPGHSCYRGLLHDVEMGTLTHNTCTFELSREAAAGLGLQEALLRPGMMEQSRSARRDIVNGQPGPPADRGARRLLAAQLGDVIAIGSEAAALYRAPLTRFARFWILCGSHVLFVIDRIAADAPVACRWNWLLNNRDGELDLKMVPPDRLVARRGDAGLKLFHLAGGTLGTMHYAHVHDAYHPLPNQLGEGRSGSGLLVNWMARPATALVGVHAVAMDDYGSIAGWHLKDEAGDPVMEAPGQVAAWRLSLRDDGFGVTETVSGAAWQIGEEAGSWRLSRGAGA